MIRGFLVNRFRGDPALFAAGMADDWGTHRLGEARAHCRILAKRPRLPAEDALGLRQPFGAIKADARRCKHRRADPAAHLEFRRSRPAGSRAVDVRSYPGKAGNRSSPAIAISCILPGSKSTIPDLRALKAANGWDVDLIAHVRRGGRVLGLCGGYQMLGRSIADPDGVEGPAGTVPGLGLLDVETVLSGEKRLAAVTGETADGTSFSGYEMHMGATEGPGRGRPFCSIRGLPEGAVSMDGRVIGTYAHGLFADDRQRAAWLHRLGAGPSRVAYEDGVEATLDALAAHLEAHIDLDRLLSLAAPVGR
jgi:adenosylcobyric acid synthase